MEEPHDSVSILQRISFPDFLGKLFLRFDYTADMSLDILLHRVKLVVEIFLVVFERVLELVGQFLQISSKYVEQEGTSESTTSQGQDGNKPYSN